MDNVNHPEHYTKGIEVLEYVESWDLHKDAYIFNVIKYVTRAKHKNNELEDLKKAMFYLNRKITLLENEKRINEQTN